MRNDQSRKTAERAEARARLHALPPRRQAQLLDPAEAEFAQYGFAAASLNRILAAAQMSKGQAYYYVTSKADLYAAVIARAFERLISAIGPVIGQPTEAEEFWSEVEQLMSRITAALLKNERLARLACTIHESDLTRTALTDTRTALRGGLVRLIELGQSIGAVRRDLPQSLLRDVLFGMALEMDRWFAAHWRDLDAAEAVRLHSGLHAMLRAAAAPPPTTKKEAPCRRTSKSKR